MGGWVRLLQSALPDEILPGNARDFWLFSGLYAVATYSGGLWAVLLFRQVTAAFWFALLIPLALVVTTLISLPTGVSDQT